MDKNEAAAILGLSVWDCALPQGFVDQCRERLSLDDYVPGHFVWCYDDAAVFGYPRPLSARGIEILTRYNAAFGTQYQTEFRVID
jgi:hypothetical protein